MALLGYKMAKYQEWLQDEKLILLQGWARSGLNDEQIAKNMGINIATYYRWKKEHYEFCEAIKKGKEVADFEVENALYKRAVGYDAEEKTYERKIDPATGEYELVCTKRTIKHIAPDPTSMIFWLKKRKPDAWGDNVTTDDESITLLRGILAEQRKEALDG